jgi:hypothetical protein
MDAGFWQPICEAPRDRRPLLCVHVNSGIMAVSWRKCANSRVFIRHATDNGWQPTHFQEVPAPPPQPIFSPTARKLPANCFSYRRT